MTEENAEQARLLDEAARAIEGGARRVLVHVHGNRAVLMAGLLRRAQERSVGRVLVITTSIFVRELLAIEIRRLGIPFDVLDGSIVSTRYVAGTMVATMQKLVKARAVPTHELLILADDLVRAPGAKAAEVLALYADTAQAAFVVPSGSPAVTTSRSSQWPTGGGAA